MSLTTVTARGVQTSPAPAPQPITTSPSAPSPTTSTSTPTTGGGGLAQARRVARTTRLLISGSVFPLTRGARVHVERLVGGRWSAAGSVRPVATGRYALAVAAPGRYRVLYAGVTGPVVKVG